MATNWKERGLLELYRDDPERADALVFGRRGVLRGAGLATMGASTLGAWVITAAGAIVALAPEVES